MTTATTDIKVSWKYPDKPIVYGLALYYRRKGDTAWKFLGKYTETEVKLPDLDVNTQYEFASCFVDGDGKPNINDLAYHSETFEGTTSIPPTPSNFGATQAEDKVALKWTGIRDKCRDFDYYEIRQGTAWGGSLFVAKVTSAEEYSHAWAVAGSTTYHLAAFDKYGKRSTAVTATVVVKDLGNFVADTEQDEDTGGFTGTKTDCEVETGDLITTRFGDPGSSITILGEDWTFPAYGPPYAEYETAQQDMGSSRNVRVAFEIEAGVESGDDWMTQMGEDWTSPPMLPPTLEDGSHIDRTDRENYQQWGECIGAGDESAIHIDIWIKLDSGSWLPYVPGFYYARYLTFKVRIWSQWFWRRIRVPKLRYRSWKLNLKDEGTFAVSGAGPHAVTIYQPFIDAPYIDARHSVDTNWVSVSSITKTGFNATVYDDDGNEVTSGSIYWTGLGT